MKQSGWRPRGQRMVLGFAASLSSVMLLQLELLGLCSLFKLSRGRRKDYPVVFVPELFLNFKRGCGEEYCDGDRRGDNSPWIPGLNQSRDALTRTHLAPRLSPSRLDSKFRLTAYLPVYPRQKPPLVTLSSPRVNISILRPLQFNPS